jgi:hypothetical protein
MWLHFLQSTKPTNPASKPPIPATICGLALRGRLRCLFEIARVLVHLDHKSGNGMLRMSAI